MILSYLRTLVLYGVLIVIVRLMGKRQIGEMEPAEFVVTMLVANLAAIPMQDGGIPLFSGLVPILTVLGMELVLSWISIKSITFRKLLCGKPMILIENGNIMQENLRLTRISLDELTSHLRQKDVLDVTQVQYAILETDGNLSVFPYPKHRPATAKEAGIQADKQSIPMALISDGKILWENLSLMKKDLRWLRRELQSRNVAPEGVFFMTLDQQGHIFCVPKEKNK